MESKKLGFIGLGVMGSSMAKHLLAAGHEVFVYNRTHSKAKEVIDAGATWCDSVKTVADHVDIVFTIIGYPKDVEEVYFGEEGLLNSMNKGSIVVDMTTSKPGLAKKIYDGAKEKGIFSLDAPVSGGDIGAKNGALSIMVGGDKEVYEEVVPYFQSMGKTIEYMGSAGSGQHTKMANQINIANCSLGTVETLMYAQKAGLDLNNVLTIVGGGSGSSWNLVNLGPKVLDGNFDPGFFIKHFVKDMGIALEECNTMGLKLHGLELVHSFYEKAIAMNLENEGTQALYKVIKAMNEE